VLSILSCLTGAGCVLAKKEEEKKEPFAAVVARNRSDAQARVAAIRAVAGKQLPSLSADRITSSGARSAASENVQVFAIEAARQLGTPNAKAPPDDIFGIPFDIDNVARWVKVRSPPARTLSSAEDHPEDAFKTLRETRYLLLVRQLSYVPPVVMVTAGVGGGYRGEAHLVDTQGNYYGGVRFEATSSRSIEGNPKDMASAARSDLENNTHKALEAAFHKHAPGFSISW
jgi:hypothetical protein